MRILPHHQNTGGFFIVLIRKLPVGDQLTKTPVEIQSNSKDPSITALEKSAVLQQQQPPEADSSRAMKAPAAKRLKHVYEENPFKFLEPGSEVNDESNHLLNDWPRIK